MYAQLEKTHEKNNSISSEKINKNRSRQGLTVNKPTTWSQDEYPGYSLYNPEPLFSHPKENKTGLPDNLKSGIENISGYSMDDVNVHYNSPKPSQVGALAYAQGTNIFVASGQEKHLPHEAWHVVQQKQGRVNPTTKLDGTSMNSDPALEFEADSMGNKAKQFKLNHQPKADPLGLTTKKTSGENTIQRMMGLEFETKDVTVSPGSYKNKLGSGDGFKVEGDSGNMEIVTNPFPITKAGKTELEKSVNKAVAFIDKLTFNAPKTLTKGLTFEGVTWDRTSKLGNRRNTQKKPFIKKTNTQVKCHPQATMGIPLDSMMDLYQVLSQENPEIETKALPHFQLDERGNGKWKALQQHMLEGLNKAQSEVNRLKKKHSISAQNNTQKLTGLLTQILTSIESAKDQKFQNDAKWNNHNVKKNQFVLLPKTKLHYLYQLLSKDEKTLFDDWLKEVTPTFVETDTILGTIKIADWLCNIKNPQEGKELAQFDQQIEGLGSDTYANNKSPDRTLKAMTDNLGSPTNIGTDQTATGKNETGGIFEFRHLKAGVPLTEWSEVATEAMSLAMWLENKSSKK